MNPPVTTVSSPDLHEPSRRRLWLAAIKPPMYSVAVIPITVGTAVAYGTTQVFHGAIFGQFLGAAIAIIAWLNLSNDVFDADTGIDQNKAHSVVNLTGNQRLVFWVSNAFLLLGFLSIIDISWEQQDPMVVLLMVLACALGYSYQGPPFRLGYQGLGEIICFITFGPLAIAAVYYSQTQTFSPAILGASILVGLNTSVILFCSHFHQIADDLAAGKRSPLVRLGTLTGAKVLTIGVLSFYGVALALIALGQMPTQTGLIALSLPFAWQLVNYVQQYHDQPLPISRCKFLAVNWHFTSGLLLAIGYGWSGLLP